MEFVFGLLGFLGGILCAAGDILFDYKGRGSEKLGRYKFMESAWAGMAPWRFKVSILLASAGVPLYFLGFTSLALQMRPANSGFALAFWLVSMVGSVGGIFIHVLLCCFPLLYKTMLKNGRPFAEVEQALNAVFDAVKLPFFILYICIVVVPSCLFAVAVAAGYLALPLWSILLTPLCLMVVGVSLRLLKKEWFNDLPGIVMPSLGLAMLGLLAAVNTTL